MSIPADPTLDCLICRKQRGEIFVPGGSIYTDELVYASHAHFAPGADTVYQGWLVIETRRHAPSMADLSDAEGQAVGLLAARLSRALQALLAPEHIYAFVIGHGVAHFHMHIIPRYPEAPREYWGVRVDEWPGAPRLDAQQAQELCERIRRQLA
jgi:histidine triad (HIT) family protein